MNIKNLLLASATGLFFANGAAIAQGVNNYGCYTDEMTLELEKKYPNQRAQQEAIEQQIQQFISQNKATLRQAGPVMKIPVVVHVVTENGISGTGSPAISKAQILNGIEVLNDDFRKLNPDTTSIRQPFKRFAADLEVEFFMARKDPQGNPTEGIVRVTSLTSNGPITRNDVKAAAPAWPTDKYFNIWLVKTISPGSTPGTILGYAQFPGSGVWNEYGLVMLHNQWGKSGAVPGTTANSDGRTATHEVGHCFNLFHTFQGGCGSAAPNHLLEGDRCGDTPQASGPTYGCGAPNTCFNDHLGTNTPYTTDQPDQRENYMSYDDCQRMFTMDQRTRAHAVLTTIPQLVNLSSPANAAFTAIDPNVVVAPLAPKAYYGLLSGRVCAGGSLNFINETYDGAATSYAWSFPGGTPSTSTAANPVVTYNTPGDYDVTLTATSPAGTTTYTVAKQVRVSGTATPPVARAQQQYVEDFEDTAFPINTTDPSRNMELNSFKVVPNVAGATTFERTQVASTSGTASIRLRNSSIPVGTITSLITPNIDVTGNTGSMYLSFDLAYALKSSSVSEEMKVFISSDCGNTWVSRSTKSGTALATNGGAIVSSFTPSASQWRKETVIITPNLLTTGKIMVKIEVTSNNGNTLYIDNLRVYTLLGTGEALAENNIKVYPNPVTAETGISFDLKSPEKVAVKIVDLTGKTVFQQSETTFGKGSHNLPLYANMKNLKAGMYLVEVKFGDKIYNTKLIAQ